MVKMLNTFWNWGKIVVLSIISLLTNYPDVSEKFKEHFIEKLYL